MSMKQPCRVTAMRTSIRPLRAAVIHAQQTGMCMSDVRAAIFRGCKVIEHGALDASWVKSGHKALFVRGFKSLEPTRLKSQEPHWSRRVRVRFEGENPGVRRCA